MNALRRYLEREEISQAEFARRIGVTRGRVYQLITMSDQTPTLELAAAIEKETRGAVKMAEWLK